MKKVLLPAIIIAIVFASSCKKSSDEASVPYTKFMVNGVQKVYPNYSRLSKDVCASSTFCGTFNLNDYILPNELLKIGLPGDPYVGQILKSGDYRFVFTYVDNAGVWFKAPGGSLQLTIVKWEGQGGWGCATFSGWLKSDVGDSLQIQNGYFQDQIWTTFSK